MTAAMGKGIDDSDSTPTERLMTVRATPLTPATVKRRYCTTALS